MTNMSNVIKATKDYALLGVRPGLSIPAGDGSNPLSKGLNGIGGINLAYMDSSSPLVLNPVVPIVIATPGMFKSVHYMQKLLVEYVQTRAKSISGIGLTYSLATEDSQVGHDGQSMTIYTNTTRGGVNPSITSQELPGMPIWQGHRSWMFNINHPDTKLAFTGIPNGDTLLFTSANITMTIAFIQYDATGRPDNILEGFVVSNMAPTDIGEMGSERNLGEVRAMERSISYGGFMNHNEGTRNLCYEIALALQYHKVDPFASNIRPYGFNEVDKALKDISIQRDITQFLADNTPTA
jgi:hypothetical protein